MITPSMVSRLRTLFANTARDRDAERLEDVHFAPPAVVEACAVFMPSCDELVAGVDAVGDGLVSHHTPVTQLDDALAVARDVRVVGHDDDRDARPR